MNEIGSTVLGVFVLILTACFDALGYNIQRRDHCKNALSHKPRHECFRKYWHLGLYIYISSLVFGNTIAMNMVKAHWVAPITTSSLIFNVVFARFLVGTKITKRDILGTAVIVSAICAILLLTSISNENDDVEINLDIEVLMELFSRITFIIYFAIINGILVIGFLIYIYLSRALRYPEKGLRTPAILSHEDPKILSKNLAIIVSVLGGIGASETVILAKSGVTYLNSALGGNWPFFQPAAVGVVFGLGLSAAFQVFLNAFITTLSSVY
ncbi:hypothetical protein DSO57_1027531 [Entomophthora muscae]|uniref:Uncharacterized protein n=1 Tax=Entomophthora muscae TaxID=34485 RepID=A0ACC2S3G3_9FUNG|nr:hypothetical protein DSO57_1027531 [Entomophthora muscae]